MPLMTSDALRAYIEDWRIRGQIAWNMDYPTEVELAERRVATARRICCLMRTISKGGKV